MAFTMIRVNQGGEEEINGQNDDAISPNMPQTLRIQPPELTVAGPTGPTGPTGNHS